MVPNIWMCSLPRDWAELSRTGIRLDWFRDVQSYWYRLQLGSLVAFLDIWCWGVTIGGVLSTITGKSAKQLITGQSYDPSTNMTFCCLKITNDKQLRINWQLQGPATWSSAHVGRLRLVQWLYLKKTWPRLGDRLWNQYTRRGRKPGGERLEHHITAIRHWVDTESESSVVPKSRNCMHSALNIPAETGTRPQCLRLMFPTPSLEVTLVPSLGSIIFMPCWYITRTVRKAGSGYPWTKQNLRWHDPCKHRFSNDPNVDQYLEVSDRL